MTRLFRLLVVLAAVLTLAVTTGTSQAADPVFREQASSGWAPTNGIVYAIVQVGDTTLVGGSFTQLRDASTGQLVTRNRIAAFDRRSGALLSSFTAGADGVVRALETDGTRVYAAGAFTSIGGLGRARVAALDATSGRALSSFTAAASSTVFALELSEGTLYLGGWFTQLNGAYRSKLGAVDAASGALRTGFTAAADGTVLGLAAVPGTPTLAVAGEFTRLGGAARSYLGSVSTSTGAVTGWAPPPECSGCVLFGVTARADLVYGAVGGPGGRASAWSTSSGTRRWSQYGDGDVQAVRVVGDTLYAGGHFAPQFGAADGTAAQRSGIAAMDASTGRLLPYDPAVVGPHGVWAIDGDRESLWVGGGYTTVNGSGAAARLTRFGVDTASSSATLVPAAASWRYEDSGADLGTGWRAPAFADAAWAQGPAQLGFGDGDESTQLRSGRLTYYFRHTFSVADPAAVSALALQHLRDDGAVVYLNGTEVSRSNLPTGTITASTPASTAVAGSDEQRWHSTGIDPRLLRAGTNVLAVEVHQSGTSSSDVSFAAALTRS